jgi:hypothetical protein
MDAMYLLVEAVVVDILRARAEVPGKTPYVDEDHEQDKSRVHQQRKRRNSEVRCSVKTHCSSMIESGTPMV